MNEMENKCTDVLKIKNIYFVDWDKTEFNKKYPNAKELLTEEEYNKFLHIFKRKRKIISLLNDIDSQMSQIDYCRDSEQHKDLISLMIENIKKEYGDKQK